MGQRRKEPLSLAWDDVVPEKLPVVLLVPARSLFSSDNRLIS